jgi:hypothetical protein
VGSELLMEASIHGYRRVWGLTDTPKAQPQVDNVEVTIKKKTGD